MNIDGLGEALVDQLLAKRARPGDPGPLRPRARRPGRAGTDGTEERRETSWSRSRPRRRGSSPASSSPWASATSGNVWPAAWPTGSGRLEALSAAAPAEELVAVEDIGPQVAESVVFFFAQAENRKLLARLEAGRPRPVVRQGQPAPAKPLQGQVFVITGTLSELEPRRGPRADRGPRRRDGECRLGPDDLPRGRRIARLEARQSQGPGHRGHRGRGISEAPRRSLRAISSLGPKKFIERRPLRPFVRAPLLS